MALYLTKLVNGQVQKLRVSPTKATYRGYWAVIVGGFAGTSVTCNGVTKFIGSSERVAFNITTAGTYTFTATRQGTTITKEVVLNDDIPEYIINLSMFIGVQPLEYIESTDTQWIDTGVVPHNGYSCELTFQFTSVIPSEGEQMDAQICGVRQSEVPDRFYPIAVNSSGYLRCAYGNTQVVYDSMTSAQVLEKHTVKLNKNGHIYLDDVDYGSCLGTYVEPQNPQYTMYLFKWNYGPTPFSNPICKMKIYSYKLWDNNGDLVSDFIPIKDDTRHGAMYDKVTQQIFYNSGTGEFICGPNKPYTRIQYLQSTGTQYIDTGVVGDLNTEYEIIVKTNATPSSGGVTSYAIFGSRTSATENNVVSTYSINDIACVVINDFGNYNVTRQIPTISATEILHKYKLTNSKSKRTITDLDTGWTDTVTTEYSGPLTTPTNLYIGYAGSIGGISNIENLQGNIYSCKIWNNGTLVRDMIPVLDYDGTPCMYDQVEGKLYYNSGTGEFIAGPEKILPDEYAELEYLQSSGTQYIDTGIKVDSDTTTEAVGRFTSLTGTTQGAYQLFGVDDNIPKIHQFGISGDGSWFVAFGSNGHSTATSANTNEHTFVVKKNSSGYGALFIDGSQIVTDANNTFTTTKSYLIFRRYYYGGGSTECWSKFQLKSFKFTKNSITIMNLIPAKHISDNVLGMYDAVTGTFFTNAGTGEFIAGPEK